MPKTRSRQIAIEATPYYHCMSRCVRLAFLCGSDQLTGQCFEHRRQWIEDKIKKLGQVFSIDICAYAITSNHYHVVLHTDHETDTHWTIDKKPQETVKKPGQRTIVSNILNIPID